MQMLARLKPSRFVWICVRHLHDKAVPSVALRTFDIDATQPIGTCRHGIVYRGRRRESGREVAIKIMSTHDNPCCQFEKLVFEELLANGNQDPHVMDVLGEFASSLAEIVDMQIQPPTEAQQGSYHCFVTSFLHGGSLMDVINKKIIFTQRLLRDACYATYATRREVIERRRHISERNNHYLKRKG